MTRYTLASLCLAATLCVQTNYAQDANPSTAVGKQASTTPVAYVYVTTSKGTDVYGAASTGKLTLVSGSPFPTSGYMVGSNGKYLVTLTNNDVHSYKIASNGAVGPQESELDTNSYSGSKCGGTAGGVLDHTGQDVNVSLKGSSAGDGNLLCSALQASSISSSSGALTFKGSLVFDEDLKITGSDTLPVFLGNNAFAYSTEATTDSCQTTLNIFARESSGVLKFAGSQNVTYPAPPSGGYEYYSLYASHVPSSVSAPSPSLITDDSSNHLAVALFAMTDPPCGPTKNPQLASFTAESNGSLKSTNKSSNMPSLPGPINVMRMSPSGKLLAVATGTGVQLFHFNGSSPITKFTGVVGTSGYIIDLQWDKSNHLYAINGASGNLHVYTATSTGLEEAAGSPYANGAKHLAVVSK